MRDLEKRVKKKSAFIICPVRGASEEEKKFIDDYVANLEAEGWKAHYPLRDTNQDDPIGLNICSENRQGIRDADEVHVYWNGKSTGSLFDLGMSFMAGKPVVLFNRYMVKKTPSKSFENVLLALDERYRKERRQNE